MKKYAVSDKTSVGRNFKEPKPTDRTNFQRDRDRIIHSKPFRRLQYKTQVFTAGTHDMYRTRLTHSIEVSQIARTVARALGINEDLSEVIALAHDIGHSPFGHVGQDALNECMIQFGGFEHNLQALRIVDKLEKSYITFDGLNLMFETREGLVKHCSPKIAKDLANNNFCFSNKKNHTLETQIVNIVDAIGYNNHDIDDGIRSGIISFEEILSIDIYRQKYEEVLPLIKNKKISESQIRFEVFRRVLSSLIQDIINNTKNNLKKYNILDLNDIRDCGVQLGSLSEEMYTNHSAIKKFLRERLYMNKKISFNNEKSKQIIKDLFINYVNNIELLPLEYAENISEDNGNYISQNSKERIVCDYISGMTDRYAILNHRNLFGLDKDY